MTKYLIATAIAFYAITNPAHAQHRNTGNRYLDCIYNRTADLISRGDARAVRSVEATRRGHMYGIGPPEYARAYHSMLRENERAFI
jgi:hypothetical protein